jgi:hypothetical protein
MSFCFSVVTADEQKERDGVLMRMQMTESYLKSKTATKIEESGNAEAIQLLEKARQLLDKGKQELEQGNFAAAKQQLSLSIQTFTAAGAANKGSQDSSKKLVSEVSSLQSEIDAYLVSFRSALEEKGPSMSGLLDQQYVESLMASSQQSKSSGDYQSAISNLTKAKNLVVDALIKIRNNETVVYTVEFQTPADEFRYEQERFNEYISLSDTLLEKDEFSEGKIKLFQMQKKAGQQISEEAETLANQGDFESAISRMEDAVKKMVQGLRVLGIQLSM